MPTQSSSTATPYTPPLEMLQAAETMLAQATPEDLAIADKLYMAYGGVTGGRSAVTGAELPEFEICRPLVKAGWLASVREARALLGQSATLRIDTTDLDTRLAEFKAEVEEVVNGPEGRTDPFLMGISEIASATRDLAEATKSVGGDEEPVANLIESVTKALNERVRALATPPAESTATA
ncbi:MAG TPA: hypothetical protein VFZ09_27530 [Archangium sp.]|uniref:hypothetical protein n=1 Tax=Archangium sp. TaxID=1872627 RepID=UPI002E2FD48E|nr:hypothetical protein [Archangium sp.]HEX5750012.1 hypothetical protein [Archangium sp.]